MNEIMKLNSNGKVTSLEMVKQINFFREQEGNRAELQHKTLLEIIRDEFSDEIDEQKILPISYKDSMNREKPMFELTLQQGKQILMRESKFVRKAMIKYIEELESRLKNVVIKQDSYMIEDPIERAKRWIEEYEEKKQLEQNLVKTQKKLEHKQEVVNCLVDEVKLKTQRQFLNEIIKMKGVELISTRWNILYKSYEQNKHINLKARIEAYNLIHKPKIKNKLEYIEVVLQDIPKLYSIAVKLFESDFKDKLKKYYEAL